MASQSQIKYPIYIVSKGRADIALTPKIFLDAGIPFTIVVEPQEYDKYCERIPSKFVEKLPFSNLGLGSFPARNYCLDQSTKLGYERHYVFDDNIHYFYRLNNGKRSRDCPIMALTTLEKLTDRYENVAVSGFNYVYFATKTTSKPFVINSHVYSGMLINNKAGIRWRLKYNEDVDLCLQALNTGKWCTILLNAFLIFKVSTTAKMRGGNQAELYRDNDEKKKALKSSSLREVWPQYVKIAYRYNRPHHVINWKQFTCPLLKKASKIS